MKIMLKYSLLLCVSSLSTFAFGNPVVSPPVQCVLLVAGSGLTVKEQLNLCTGATSDAPARCFAYTSGAGMSSSQRLSLCQLATSDAPFRCYESSGIED